jgi:hypothetical protein
MPASAAYVAPDMRLVRIPFRVHADYHGPMSFRRSTYARYFRTVIGTGADVVGLRVGSIIAVACCSERDIVVQRALTKMRRSVQLGSRSLPPNHCYY